MKPQDSFSKSLNLDGDQERQKVKTFLTAGTSLKIILVISILGMIFSGYLSYSELFGGVCLLEGGCTSVAKIPACVYWFVMYLIVFAVSLLGLSGRRK